MAVRRTKKRAAETVSAKKEEEAWHCRRPAAADISGRESDRFLGAHKRAGRNKRSKKCDWNLNGGALEAGRDHCQAAREPGQEGDSETAG